jgi:hypothetical protein
MDELIADTWHAAAPIAVDSRKFQLRVVPLSGRRSLRRDVRSH